MHLKKRLLDAPEAFVGEIGLDGIAKDPKTGLKYDFETQYNVFKAQYDLACELKRPVSIHAVQVAGKIYDFLSSQVETPPAIMLHSFNASPDMIKRLLKIKAIGHKTFFSLSYAVNFRSKNFTNMVSTIPDDKILLESDCHDINSVDSYMQDILQSVANAKGWDLAETASIVSRNTSSFLNFTYNN